MELFAFSSIGNSRSNQEDNYLLGKGRFLTLADSAAFSRDEIRIDRSHSDCEDFCVVVSDGMGGHEKGEYASYRIVSYLSDRYEELLNLDDKNLSLFVTKLNYWFCNAVKKEYHENNMGATICGVLKRQGQISCFNAGDSRCYYFKDGKLKKISVDNNEGQRLLNYGLLTKEEAEKFPNRKALYKYIGFNSELIPDLYSIEGDPDGALLLLCSDGLTDVVFDEELEEMLNKKNLKIEEKGRFLVGMAAERRVGHGDNITLLIVKM